MVLKSRKKTMVISVGGSLIAPNGIDAEFLRDFKDAVIEFARDGNKAVIVCGGGATNKVYNSAALQISQPSSKDLDWLGIAATKLNAELMRVIFSSHAHEKVVYDPTKKIKTSKNIIIASGWKPGCSSDHDAVLLAVNVGAKEVINLTNIDYVYDKDPRQFPDAKQYESLTWKQYLAIVGTKWSPRMNVPFDPIAAKFAQEKKLTVRIINGKKPENIKRLLAAEKVNGTVIR